jgi:putative transposase
MNVFFSDADRLLYLHVLREQANRYGVHFAAWCLMQNHVHLVVVPEHKTSLARGIGEAHRRYTCAVNQREGWQGYLFQGRFFSCPLEGAHVLAAIRYVLRNPVRAGIVAQPWQYEWSSAQWMVGRAPADPLAELLPLTDEVPDWEVFLCDESPGDDALRRHTQTGRPLGSPAFVERLEAVTGRVLRYRPPGRRPKE